jgi:hypothetical protein
VGRPKPTHLRRDRACVLPELSAATREQEAAADDDFKAHRQPRKRHRHLDTPLSPPPALVPVCCAGEGGGLSMSAPASACRAEARVYEELQVLKYQQHCNTPATKSGTPLRKWCLKAASALALHTCVADTFGIYATATPAMPATPASAATRAPNDAESIERVVVSNEPCRAGGGGGGVKHEDAQLQLALVASVPSKRHVEGKENRGGHVSVTVSAKQAGITVSGKHAKHVSGKQHRCLGKKRPDEHASGGGCGGGGVGAASAVWANAAAHEKEEESDDDFKVGKPHRSARRNKCGNKCRRVGVHAHKESVKE